MIELQDKDSTLASHSTPLWSARVLSDSADNALSSYPPPDPAMNRREKSAHFGKSTSSTHGFSGYLKEKFNKKNLFGTIFLIALIANNSQYIVAGLKQKRIAETPDGPRIESDMDYSRVIQKSMAVLTTVWTLFSSRGSGVPDGNTMLERMWDSLKHPERSQTQARELVLLPLALYGVGGHILYGAGTKPDTTNALRMNLQKAAQFLYRQPIVERAPNKERQLQAVLGMISIPLALASMFGKEAGEKKARQNAEALREKTASKTGAADAEQKAQPVPFSKSQSKSVDGKSFYLAKAAKKVWQDNPKLVISSMIGVLTAGLSFAEGLSKRKIMLAKLAEFSEVRDFGSSAGELLRKNMRMDPKYALMKDHELIGKLPQYKAEQMKEAHNLMRAGIIGIVLSLAGQIYRANEMVQDDILKEQREAGQAR